MAATSGRTEAREEIHSRTPREPARQTEIRGESQCKPRNKRRDRDRCKRAKAPHRKRRRQSNANSREFPCRPADEDRRANRPEASVFHDGFESRALEASSGRVGSLRVSVGADLHAIILVPLRRKNERRKPLLLQTVRELQRDRFFP